MYKYSNLEIPEEYSIDKFIEKYSKMKLGEAKENLFIDLRDLDAKYLSKKVERQYKEDAGKLISFMKNLTVLMNHLCRPAVADYLQYSALKSLLEQMCKNSNIVMPKIKGDDDDE